MDLALSQTIGRALRDLRATHGDAVFDRARCGSALLDTHKAHPAAIRSVLAAIDSGGARRLATADPALAAAAIEHEVRRLTDEFGLGPDHARGAMMTWAVALGLDAAIAPASRGPAAGDAASKTGDGNTTAQGHVSGAGRAAATRTSGATAPRRRSTGRRIILSITAVAAAALAFVLVPRLMQPTRVPQVEARLGALAAWQPGDPGNRRSRRIAIQIEVWNPAAVAQIMPRFRALALRGDDPAITIREWPIVPPQPTLAPYERISFRASILVDDGADLERTTIIGLGWN